MRPVPWKRSRSRSSSASGAGSCPPKKDHYRVVLMGAAGVGKTCIISQFLYEEFVSEYKATVEEMHRGEYDIEGLTFTMDILDTTGTYQFPAMRQLSISTGDAFVLVYSLDDASSFEEVKRLREQILQQKADDMTPIVIVGNKCDLAEKDRVIEKETAETTVNIDWGNGYVEASAKDNVNIVGIFTELLAQANERIKLSPAVRRRRQSLPNFGTKKDKPKLEKRNSCVLC